MHLAASRVVDGSDSTCVNASALFVQPKSAYDRSDCPVILRSLWIGPGVTLSLKMPPLIQRCSGSPSQCWFDKHESEKKSDGVFFLTAAL